MDFSLASAVDVLTRTPGTLTAMLDGLGEDWVRSDEGGDSFSPFDVVGHLIDGEETDWIPRARIILAQGKDTTFQPYDRFRHRLRNASRDLPSLLREFERLRSANIETLHSWSLTDRQLDLRGSHPDLGHVTLRHLLATWVVHDMSHLAQVARVMAKQYRAEVGPWRAFVPILQDRPTAVLLDQISPVRAEEFPEITQIWEDAVRATHHFLTDEQIRKFRPLVRDNYLHVVDLACVRTADGGITGFIGTANRKVEMLFVTPRWFRRGVGTRLMSYAIHQLALNLVDVNEQNATAVDFYRALGFKVVGRSPVDGLGLPYPILHMQLTEL